MKSWPVTLRSGPVVLRPLRRRDESDWRAIRDQAPDWFGPWDATRPSTSIDDPMTWRSQVSWFSRQARAGTMLPWAVEYRPSSQPESGFIGQLTVSGITGGSACWAQIGYWIAPAWAGRGIIPRAVAMACDHLLFARQVHRIEIAIRPENANSRSVVAKLGLPLEGRRRRYLHVAGDWRDHDVYLARAEDLPHGLLARLPAPDQVGG